MMRLFDGHTHLEAVEDLSGAIARAPLENLLLETDSPVEYQWKKSEPADVLRTLEAVARIKDVGKEVVAEIAIFYHYRKRAIS